MADPHESYLYARKITNGVLAQTMIVEKACIERSVSGNEFIATCFGHKNLRI